MSLRLTVLGGAAAWPNPGQGCSSYLIESRATTLVVDCGPDTLLELRRHTDYSQVSAILISHCHADHMLDLIPYRYGLRYGPVRPAQAIPVWVPPGGIAFLHGVAAAISNPDESGTDFWNPVFDLQEYNPKNVLEIGDMRITFQETQHFVPCYGMRIDDGDGRVIAYSADTGTIEPLRSLFVNANLGIVEATLPTEDTTPGSRRGHLSPRDAGRLAASAGLSTLVLTHLWSERTASAVTADAAEAFTGMILTAERGMIVDV